jgi:hypothetical protein
MTHMTSSQRSPLWPYLLVLTGLFLLSLAVPRGSQSDAEVDGLRSLVRRHVQTRHSEVESTVAILHPSAEGVRAPVIASQPTDATWFNSSNNTLQPGTDVAASQPASDSHISNLIGSWAETVAKKIADLRHFDVQQYLPSQNAASNANPGNDWQTGNPDGARSVYGSIESHQAIGTADQSKAADTIASNYWPVPRSLLVQLEQLQTAADCSAWAAQVKQLCVAWCQISPGDPGQASEIVQQLKSMVQQCGVLEASLKSPTAAAQLRRVRYALVRRLALWSVAVSDTGPSAVYGDVPSAEEHRKQLDQALTAADMWVRSIPNAQAWRTYLQLDDVAQLADANSSLSSQQSREIARRVLSRLLPGQLNEAQRRVLQSPALADLTDQLRTWSDETVDVHDVLAGLEEYETSGLPSDARKIAVALRQLDWSAAEQNRQLAKQLDMYYRNANVRITLAAELLNRLAPEQPSANGVVNDTILGAAVNGTSTTKSQLHVKLIPDAERLHMWIDAQGTVDSQTVSTSGPATFDHNGRSDFLVHKAVIVDRQGVWIANAAAEANTDTQLTGVRTDYDNVPLLGSFARRYAISQHNARLGEAEQETDAKVASEATQQVNAEVKVQVNDAEKGVRKSLLDPLAKLNLSPEPISLETSAQRLTLRLRLAGQNQLGGHTARPQALSDSLASVQVHESALNNILDQLQLAGRTFTLPELYRHVAQELSWNHTDPPDDVPADVQVTFAAQDPVRVRCQDGVVQLTLAFDELQHKGRQWKNFAVTVNYEPQIEDLHVRLVRQGVIELSGDEKGEAALGLRGAFSKLFPRERPLELVPAWIADNRNLSDLCISQCVAADGWIALALGPQRETAPADASVPAATATR